MSEQYVSDSAATHKQQAAGRVGCAVITVSDTRSMKNDKSGQTIVDLLDTDGHQVIERAIVPDEPTQVEVLVMKFVEAAKIEAILLTGGTGVAPRDQTPETLAKLYTKELPGYGELFRVLSYNEIGPAAMLSRASGGMVGDTLVLAMPGSTPAVRLAMEKLILPELGHLVAHGRG